MGADAQQEENHFQSVCLTSSLLSENQPVFSKLVMFLHKYFVL